jgi:hypothetical protein
MKETTNKSTQLFTPPFGGRGAKKYISPRIEWIPLDNEISLALESSPPVGPSETLNSIQSPFKENIGLV